MPFKLEKSKIYNYLLISLLIFTALWFTKVVSYNFWKFDIFNLNHLSFFGKTIITGKAFLSTKYLSLLTVLLGIITTTYGGARVGLSLDFDDILNRKKDDKNSDDDNLIILSKSDKVQEQSNENENNESVKSAKEEMFSMYDKKALEKLEEIENINEEEEEEEDEEEDEEEEIITNTQTPVIETKANTANPLEAPTQTKAQPTAPTPAPKATSPVKATATNEEEERNKLKEKIRETIEKMKNKNNAVNKEQDKPSEKLLTHMKTTTQNAPANIASNNITPEMYFEKIPAQYNSLMESNLISAGFKLLSEIRIGRTGIDYLGVANDKIVVIQFDVSEGKWLASEDNMKTEKAPLWFSDNGNKLSPVFRAMEAKKDVEILIAKEVKMPVEAVVCLANNSIVNYFEATQEWKKNNMDVDVVKFNSSFADNNISRTITDKFPMNSQTAPDEKDMEKLISILEKAEIPE